MATATNTITRYRLIETPLGEFRVELSSTGTITTAWTALLDKQPPKEWIKGDLLLPDLVEDLRKYFEGDLTVDFSYVSTPKGSDFYRKCWEAARKIPVGEVWTYGELAKAAGGKPSSARAAGQAMRNNPVPVIIPCHRVCGSGGALVGYAGNSKKESAGIKIKKNLLALEGYEPG